MKSTSTPISCHMLRSRPAWRPAVSLLLALAAWMAVAPAGAAEPVPAADAAASAAGLRTTTVKLRELGAYYPIDLRGTDQSSWLPLSIRLDESVVSAKLNLTYTLSPSLLPDLSQLKVMIDEQPLATLMVSKDKLGSPQRAVVELDPRYFVEFAKLRLQFIGHYTMECEYPLHSSLWASISNESTLELVTRPLALRNDLGLLPAPFFDSRDSRRLELPFVFAAQPSLPTLRTAGVLASWFGSLASYRGSHFPALYDKLPARHAVVLATNDERPAGLDLPRVNAPTLAVMSRPDDPTVKLLLVLGKDAAQLRTAAEALVLGKPVLTGERAEVRALQAPQPRRAYDAPAMVKTGSVVRLGELVKGAADLQVQGQYLAPIRVNLRLPADIFTWEAKGMPIDLRFRYTPPREVGQANLAVQINDQFVQSFLLQPAGKSGRGEKVLLPFLEDNGTLVTQGLTVPAFQLGSNNQLEFRFEIPAQDDGRCRSSLLSGARAAIDPDSTLDLSRIEHYAAMPNLSFFANSGFPFTKYADLSQTALVLPDVPSAPEVETALTVLGQMGAATGVPATLFELVAASQIAQAGDRDLLVVVAGASAPLLQAWGQTLPARLDAAQRAASPLGRLSDAAGEWFSDALPRVLPRDGWTELSAQGPLAALLGFESPAHPGRSVVVLNATDAQALPAAANAIVDPGKVRQVRGDLVLVRNDIVEPYRVGEVYYVGELRWWRWVWFQLHSHPLLLAVLGLLLGIVLALIAFGVLRRIAARRLAGRR
jgi:cellulose synthase operon protein B